MMKKTWRKWLLTLACGCLLMSSACASSMVATGGDDVPKATFAQYISQDIDAGGELTIGQPVLNFTFEDQDGAQKSLKDYEGKVLVLNFWASWCPPCKKEMPDLEKMHQAWLASGEATLLTVNVTDGQRETERLARKHMEEQGFSFPVIFDKNLSVSAAYASYSIPMTYVIAPDGTLFDMVVGMTNEQTLLGLVNAAQEQGGA